MTHYSRSDWGARAAIGGPGPLDPAKVEGLAFHWPAMTMRLRTVEVVMAALRSWQNFHMDGRKWSDIAYQVAVDQKGNRYELRGLRTTSGANGDGDVNGRFGAVLLLLAPGESPSWAMISEVRNVVTDHRNAFPNSTRLVGHGQIRPEPTACPGPAAQAAIDAHLFEPIPPAPATRAKTQGPLVDESKAALRKARRETDNKARKVKLSAVLEQIRTSLPSWPKR